MRFEPNRACRRVLVNEQPETVDCGLLAARVQALAYDLRIAAAHLPEPDKAIAVACGLDGLAAGLDAHG